MTAPCCICAGDGKVDRLIFRGRKPCWNCAGTGEQPTAEELWQDGKQAWRDYADEWMDRQEKDWGPDYEAGGWVPADAAEDWAMPGGAGEDWQP